MAGLSPHVTSRAWQDPYFPPGQYPGDHLPRLRTPNALARNSRRDFRHRHVVLRAVVRTPMPCVAMHLLPNQWPKRAVRMPPENTQPDSRPMPPGIILQQVFRYSGSQRKATCAGHRGRSCYAHLLGAGAATCRSHAPGCCARGQLYARGSVTRITEPGLACRAAPSICRLDVPDSAHEITVRVLADRLAVNSHKPRP